MEDTSKKPDIADLKECSLLEDEILASRNLVKQWKQKADEAKSPQERDMFLDFMKESEGHLAAHIAELKMTDEICRNREMEAQKKAAAVKSVKPAASVKAVKKPEKAIEMEQLPAPEEEKLLTTGK